MAESRKRRRERLIGAIDQGTTSTRFLIFDQAGQPQASHQIEFRQIHPRSGWHEQDPKEILRSVQDCIEVGCQKLVEGGGSKEDIAAVGISSQRETTIVWDRETGEPLHNAIAWPDTRTRDLVRELKEKKDADTLQAICGLPLSTYPSSVKLMWLLQNDKDIRTAYEEGRLAFGNVDSWLLQALNGGVSSKLHVTDVTNASRTMFMNLESLQYDDRLLEFFDIQKSKIKLPEIVPSSGSDIFGRFSSGALKGKPITGCLGDQSAALIGQAAFSPGMAKNTYGTGCFLLYNTGEKPVYSKNGLLTTVAYQLGKDQKPVYALEGSIAVAGSAIKFLRDNLKLIDHASEISQLAAEVEDSGGVVFVTAFSGLFAPYWIDDAQGTIFGLTQHTKRGHIARATLEATCFQTRAILEAMQKDSKKSLEALAVDGGMSNSDICMQTQADLIGIPVDRPLMRETTALGAALAAGYAAGIWSSIDELREINKADITVFEPAVSKEKSDAQFALWEKAVEMCKGWVSFEDTLESNVVK